ncbi:MAG: GntR family transcriptional regulator [Alphaproteobacteria bacterium]|nr:GntR family transcriptional regulator [Alphaproteobacteria bacterium]
MSAPPQPRYRQVAQTLINEIEAGRYPVGDLMPTEMELCEQFGASRFTVREAIKRLVELGLVSRQAGVGTKVLGREPKSNYRQVMQGISDLRQYTADTELQIQDARMVTVRGELAAMLEAAEGESWLRIEGIRRVGDLRTPPICLVEIYIHPAFRAVRDLGGRSTVPIFVRIEEQFGEQVAEIQQQISAAALTRRVAGMLDAKPGAPALLVSRSYRSRRGELIEVALSTHPADRFSYSQTFLREWRGAAEGNENGR